MPVNLSNQNMRVRCYAVLKNSAYEPQHFSKQRNDLSVHSVCIKDSLPTSLVILSMGSINSGRALFTLSIVCSVEISSFDEVNVKQLNKLCAHFNHFTQLKLPCLEESNVRFVLAVDFFWFIDKHDIRKESIEIPYAILLFDKRISAYW